MSLPQSHPIGVGKVARTVALVLGRILALLLTLLLCLPVALLPLATSVPALVWVLLAIVDVALLILQFRRAPTWLGITVSLAGVMVVSLIAIAASQFLASTPPITDASGKPMPGSIATLEKVKLTDALPAPAFWAGQDLCVGRVLGQRPRYLAGPALPRAVPRRYRHRPDGGL